MYDCLKSNKPALPEDPCCGNCGALEPAAIVAAIIVQKTRRLFNTIRCLGVAQNADMG